MTEILLESWKGKSGIKIEEQDINFQVVEMRKNKETGKVSKIEHKIPRENVETLWGLIRGRCDLNQKFSYKFLVTILNEKYEWHSQEQLTTEQFIDAFNGGKNRAKYYFPRLYYPLKVLEAKKLIKYFGRGGIERLSSNPQL